MFTRHFAHWSPGVPKTLSVPRTSRFFNLEVSARRYPAKAACVIGTRDAHRGETVKAIVVLKPAARGKLRPGEISDWARAHMAAFKYPRVVEFVGQLPKTGTGKIFWRRLQEEENKRCGTG